MEKISLVLDVDNPEEDLYYCTCRHIDCDHTGEWYSAADVDALLADVRRLVDAARRSYESMYAMNERTHPMDSATKFVQMHNLLTSAEELEKAIAAVERRL